MTQQFLMSNLAVYPNVGFVKFEYSDTLDGEVVITKNILNEVQNKAPLVGITYQTTCDLEDLAAIIDFAVDNDEVDTERELYFTDMSNDSIFPVLFSEIRAFIAFVVKTQAVLQLERQLKNLRIANDEDILTGSKGRKILRKISN